MTEEVKFILKKAENLNDFEFVHGMIQELADFEKMSNGPQLTVQDLMRDNNKGNCDIYIIESHKTNSNIIPIGYSICFFSYSTWVGKAYFIEDLYIKPEHRRCGAGTIVFKHLARIAKNNNCKRLDFHVLNWNQPAKLFYEKVGAIDITNSEEWNFYRIDTDQLSIIAKDEH